MVGSVEPAPPPPPPGPSQALAPWHKPVFILFLAFWAINVVLLCLEIDQSPGGRWVEGIFLWLAVVTTLLTLGRRLPLQNIATTALLVAILSGIIISVGSVTGIPFGPCVYSDRLGLDLLDLLPSSAAFAQKKSFNVLPWPLPLVWIVVIVNGRGIARLVMRPWRKTNYYGFWVIGFTCLLAVILDLSMEPFAVHVKNYWIWTTAKSVPAWYTAPWVNFLGWFVTALSILAFSIPWLINKQPIKQPVDYQPLVNWLLVNSWLMTGNAVHRLWPAVGLGLGANAVAAFYAIRGARW
jgi:uncharacterized membrane protein